MTPASPSSRPKTLSLGSATYDVFVRTGQGTFDGPNKERFLSLPLGGKFRVTEVVETCGGGAANTSVGLSRLGCDSSFGGVIGSDQWGGNIKQNFDTEGVDTSPMSIVEGETSSFSIILLSEDGERVVLYAPGTNAHLHDATFDREKAAGVDWIFLNRIHEQSCVIEDDLIEILSRPGGPKLTWNPGGMHLEEGIKEEHVRKLLAKTALLLLNKEEALAFTGQKTVEAAMRAVLDCGTNVCVVTDGKNGSMATDGKKLYQCDAPTDITIVDATGAGDAFGTAATWAMMHGKDLPEMLRTGTISSASVIGAVGAQHGLLTDTQMTQKLSSVRLEVRELPFP